MSGTFSREKGARGEREVARRLQKELGIPVERAARNGVDGAADIIGLPEFAVEVKNHAELKVAQWWQQAVEQTSTTHPHALLIYKARRGVWHAVLGVHQFCWLTDTRVKAPTGAQDEWVVISFKTLVRLLSAWIRRKYPDLLGSHHVNT